MQKIKLLHIIKSLGRGGAEMLLPETLKLHDQGKFEFHYIYFLPWKNQMVKEIESAGGTVQCFSASNNIKLLMRYKDVVTYCEDNKIDVVHCHLPWSGFLGRLVYMKTKIPVIYTEHNIQERYHPATRFLNKISFNAQTLSLGVSNDVTRSIKELIDPKVPVKTLLNGVNTVHFNRSEEKRNEIRNYYNIPADAKVIGNIAVFREQKGLPDWIRAFEMISRQNTNTYGILVGAGPQHQEINHLIEKLELSDRLFLAGLQTNTVAYFSAMDIFMMSSKFEGLPIALLEAMSMECAVVSTKAGGVTEVIEDGVSGLLCEVGDWKCLGESALKLIRNHSQQTKLQQAARERVKKSFSLTLMVEELETTYFQVYSNDYFE